MCRAWLSFLAVWFDRFSSYRNYNSSSFSFVPNMASEAISEYLILKNCHCGYHTYLYTCSQQVRGLSGKSKKLNKICY